MYTRLGGMVSVFVMVAISAAGCNEVGCAIHGDNVEGRLSFNSDIEIEPNTEMIIEWSYDGFANAAGQKRVRNTHGLITFGYSLCVDDNRDFQVRAFQDSNRDLSLDAGEASGRCDGTTDGDSAFVTKNVPDNNTADDWNTIDGVDIAIDVP